MWIILVLGLQSMDYDYNLQIMTIIHRFEKKLMCTPLGPHKTLRNL